MAKRNEIQKHKRDEIRDQDRVRVVEGHINGATAGDLAAQNPGGQRTERVLKALAALNPGGQGPECMLHVVAQFVS